MKPNFLLVVSLLAAVSILFGSSSYAGPEYRTLRARSLEIVNEDGEVVALLEASGTGSTLVLRSAATGNTVRLQAFRSEASVSVETRGDILANPSVVMSTYDSAASIVLRGQGDNGVVVAAGPFPGSVSITP